MVRELSLTVRREPERQLPLSSVEYSVKENEVLDLSMYFPTIITKLLSN